MPDVSLGVNIAQTLFNSILTGSLYVLVSVGLTLIYGILKFPNIAHAEFITFGAYVAYSVADVWKLGGPNSFNSFWFGAAVGLLASGVLGVASYLFLFSPLIKRGTNILLLTVASIGFGIFLRYSILQVWGRKTLYYSVYYVAFDLGPIRVTSLWLIFIALAAVIVVVFHFLLTKTKIGRAMRATSNNPVLAQASGIDTKKILVLVWFLGSALAGIGGVMQASDSRITSTLGWDILILAFAAVVLGGIGSIYGTIVAGYLLGFVYNFGVILLLYLHLSTAYNILLSFGILVFALLFTPQGLAGISRQSFRRLRKWT